MTKAGKKTTVEVEEPRPQPRRDVSHVHWRVWAGVGSVISVFTGLAGRGRR